MYRPSYAKTPTPPDTVKEGEARECPRASGVPVSPIYSAIVELARTRTIDKAALNEGRAGLHDQLVRLFDFPATSRATFTNALSAGDTWARLGKYRNNPGTAAAYCSSTRCRFPRRSSSAISGSNA